MATNKNDYRWGKLTRVEQKFVENVVSGKFSSWARAYDAALGVPPGTTPKTTVHSLVHRSNDRIKKVIDEAFKMVEAETVISLSRIIQELQIGAFANPLDAFGPDGQLLPMQAMPEGVGKLITEVKQTDKGTEITFTPSLGYIQQLAKHLGLTDRLDVTSNGKEVKTVLILPPKEIENYSDGSQTGE